MYGYKHQNGNTLMTNLNSISSSLSSIDTIGQRANTKASSDNLITLRSHSIASTSPLWKAKDDRHSTVQASARNGHLGSEIYYTGKRKKLSSYCLNPRTASNFTLVPLLLLTITRQVFDFLGQIWLQILINFFTIIIIIVALFGVRQSRSSYLSLFSVWALFNTSWNFLVICIYSKIRDVGINEDALSIYSGATSWWHSNGPGCLPYNISSIQPSITIHQPNIVTGCRLDYHVIEAAQATIHAFLTLLSLFVCCCILTNIKHKHGKRSASNGKPEKSFRLNSLINDRSRVNQDPYPTHASSRFCSNTGASLRRSRDKTSSRSSQHSMSSYRSARRRNRSIAEGSVPAPRGSTSSATRSQHYGSLSSRRSSKKDRRSDVSSLTYGTTGTRASTSRRNRLSSLSSAEYLPSYQPPHSSNANLLSSYGEISSVDSYNNHTGQTSAKTRQASMKASYKGATNPTYTGSRSSICSRTTNNNNNYDDLSYIYGNNNARNSESFYNPPTTSNNSEGHKQQIYSKNQSNSSIGSRNAFKPRESISTNQPQKIQAETYHIHPSSNHQNGSKSSMAKTSSNGFQSFSVNNQRNTTGKEETYAREVNNNYRNSNYQDTSDRFNKNVNSISSPFESQSHNNTNGHQNINNVTNQSQIYATQRSSRHPIYSNQVPNGNSETPI